MKCFDGTTYTKQLRRRLIGWIVMLIIHIAYLVFLSEIGGGDSRIQTREMHTAMAVIGFGGIAWMTRKIYIIRRLLRNPMMQKEKLINEKDERNRYLHDKSGGDVWDLQLVGLLAVTLTTSMFNREAFFAVSSLLIFSVSLKLGFYLWHSRH